MNLLDVDWDQIGRPRILVLGDAMLDRYTWGTAERVSPEAPVLVLRADQREVRLGGAASVAGLLRSLEAEVTLAAVIGDDHDGRTIQRLVDEMGIDSSILLVDAVRPTTSKERFLGRSDHRQPHQMLRVDSESREPIEERMVDRFLERISAEINRYQAVLISDYAKGVCGQRLIGEVISIGRQAGIPVLVDPGRGVEWEIYRGAKLIKPNRLEAEIAIGNPIRSPGDAKLAANDVREQYGFEIVCITLDRDGLVYATSIETTHQPISPHEVCDITGAGDTVLATLGLGLAVASQAEEISFAAIADLANVAAGLQVAQSGVAPISRTDLVREYRRSQGNEKPGSTRILTLEAAEEIAAEYRRRQKTLVFTNGCFDLLHVGHVSMLEDAVRFGDVRFGDVLFVAINSDDSVRRLKGPTRPVISATDRARMLASLECVDHVLIFDQPTPHRLLEAIRPDVLVKGGTTPEIVGREIVEAYGGRIKRIGEIPDVSTTLMIAQLRSVNCPSQ